MKRLRWVKWILCVAVLHCGAAVSLPLARAEQATIIGAPVDSLPICEKNLSIITHAAIGKNETLLEASCQRLESLNTDSGDVEIKFQPQILTDIRDSEGLGMAKGLQIAL